MVTVGLNLHRRYITACAVDDTGGVLAEARRLDPSLDALGSWLSTLPQPLTVALEATLLVWLGPVRAIPIEEAATARNFRTKCRLLRISR